MAGDKEVDGKGKEGGRPRNFGRFNPGRFNPGRLIPRKLNPRAPHARWAEKGAGLPRLIGVNLAAHSTAGLVAQLLPLLVLHLEASPSEIGVATAARMLPPLLFIHLAGLVADRVKDPRRVRFWTMAVRAVLPIGLVLTEVTGTLSVPVVWCLAFGYGTATTFDEIPAQIAARTVARPDERKSADNLLRAGYMAGDRLIGPAACGALLAAGPLFGVWTALPAASAVVAFILAAVLVRDIKLYQAESDEPSGRTTGNPRRSIGKDLLAGLRAWWSIRESRLMSALLCITNVGWLAEIATVSVYGHQRFGMGWFGLAVLGAGSGIGSVLSSLAQDRLDGLLRPVPQRWLALAVLLGAHVGIALAGSPAVALLCMIAVGFMVNVLILQAKAIRYGIPDEEAGRGESWNSFFTKGGGFLGGLVGGPLFERAGTGAPAWFAAALVAVAATLTMLMQRQGRSSPER